MKDNTISEVDFSNPDEVVFCFIGSAKDLLKKTDIASTDLMDIVAFYTTLKYHPYDNHLHLLRQIAYVREIEKTIINGKKARIVTKAVKNLIPLGILDLEMKNGKWKICDFKIQRGTKKYYSLVRYESEIIDEI